MVQGIPKLRLQFLVLGQYDIYQEDITCGESLTRITGKSETLSISENSFSSQTVQNLICEATLFQRTRTTT